MEFDFAVDRFIREGWMNEPPEDRSLLILGPRALAELRHKTAFVDRKCFRCGDTVVYGIVKEEKHLHYGCEDIPDKSGALKPRNEVEIGLNMTLKQLEQEEQQRAFKKMLNVGNLELAHNWVRCADGSASTSTQVIRSIPPYELRSSSEIIASRKRNLVLEDAETLVTIHTSTRRRMEESTVPNLPTANENALAGSSSVSASSKVEEEIKKESKE
jgi:hypothetical protein